MGSYQPGIRPQFAQSPGKCKGDIRSPSPFEYNQKETVYAELKSSLMMMCARKSDSRILTDSWATRNMKSSSTAQGKRIPTPG